MTGPSRLFAAANVRRFAAVIQTLAWGACRRTCERRPLPSREVHDLLQPLQFWRYPMSTNLTRRTILSLPLGRLAASTLGARFAWSAAEPIKIGLVAALSGPSAKSDEGITRGLTVAIDEI